MTGPPTTDETGADQGQAQTQDQGQTETQVQGQTETQTQDQTQVSAGERRLRAADPADQRRRDVMPAGSVLAVMIGTLVLAAAINSGAMLERSQSGPLGPARDRALALWTPVHAVSSRLGLTGPRDGLDALRHGSGTDPDGATEMVAGAPAGPTAATARDPGPSLLGSLLTPQGATPPGSTSPGTDPTTPVAPGPGTTAPDPNGSRHDGSGPPTTPAGAPVATPLPDQLRRPTPDDPLRILIVGDSTMDALGASLLRDLGQTGLTDATLEFRVSSGLARPDFFDWPATLRTLRAERRTELVVIMIGANDAQPFLIDGQPENFGTERWIATYRARVAALLDELTADGAGVLWLGEPVMRNEGYDRDMTTLNQVFAEEVARFPRARYLDTRPVLSDDSGAYAAYLTDDAGNRQRVRQDDGVHLTEGGADRLAPAVVEAVNTLAPLY